MAQHEEKSRRHCQVHERGEQVSPGGSTVSCPAARCSAPSALHMRWQPNGLGPLLQARRRRRSHTPWPWPCARRRPRSLPGSGAGPGGAEGWAVSSKPPGGTGRPGLRARAGVACLSPGWLAVMGMGRAHSPGWLHPQLTKSLRIQWD